jgi:hypothetical protein
MMERTDRRSALRCAMPDARSPCRWRWSCWSVFLFLRNVRAALIPCVAVPVSLTDRSARCTSSATGLDNLSLMALTIATGFVVDDAIVVSRTRRGMSRPGWRRRRRRASGAGEVGFTVLRMTLSLVAVFIPLLLMGGFVGRFFPRIRGDAVGGDTGLARGVAHDDADDVLAASTGGEGAPPGPVPRVERAGRSRRC